jgi:hypothetical protein
MPCFFFASYEGLEEPLVYSYFQLVVLVYDWVEED